MPAERNQREEALVVHRLLVGFVSIVCRFPRLVLLAAMTMVALSIYLACTQLSFLTQRNDLVSPDKEYQLRWQEYLDEFGDDDDMVVVVQGDNRRRMKQALEQAANSLRAQPDLFDRIFYKVDLRPLQNRALLFLSVEEIRAIQDSLLKMNLLLETTNLLMQTPFVPQVIDPLAAWKSLNLSQLFKEAEERSKRIKKHQQLPTDDRQFFAQLTTISKVAADVVDDPENYRSPWRSIVPKSDIRADYMTKPKYFFSDDGALAFLLVRPAKQMESFTSAKHSIAAMRKIIERMRTEYADLEIGLTGLPVLENDEMIASQSDTATASWLALLGVALLYLLIYRCLRYPLLTVGTLLVGTIWALGWLTVTVGHLNILSATFAVMLIGLGDYGVLWVTRYEQERAKGADAAAAMRLTAENVGPSIRTAAITTTLAFFTAMLVDFRAVAELGWIAGSGVLLCALACFTVLPALITLIDKNDTAPKKSMRLAERNTWLPTLNRRPRYVVGATVLAVVAGGFSAFRVSYDHNLLRLQARNLESVQWELKLIEHTAGASWHALSVTSSRAEALALKARYEQLPGVSQVVEVASLIPREQEEKMPLLSDIQNRLRALPKRGDSIPHTPVDVEDLLQQIEKLSILLKALETYDSRNVVAQLRAGLQHLRHQLANTERAKVVKRLQYAEESFTQDLAEDLRRLRDVSTPAAITLDDLPSSLRDRYVSKSGKWLLRIFGEGSLWEYQVMKRFVKQIREVDPDVTGKPISTAEGLGALRAGFQWASIYALVAMIVVLFLDFGHLGRMLLALLPLAIGVVVTLGIMGLFGLPFNPANIIALPLILGVGADNGVHILHDYLLHDRKKRYALSYSTGRGIMVAALTTIFGFGTLMISQHRGLSSLGLLLTIGVGCCTLTALVFLPALLRLLSRPINTDHSEIPTIPPSRAA